MFETHSDFGCRILPNAIPSQIPGVEDVETRLGRRTAWEKTCPFALSIPPPLSKSDKSLFTFRLRVAEECKPLHLPRTLSKLCASACASQRPLQPRTASAALKADAPTRIGPELRHPLRLQSQRQALERAFCQYLPAAWKDSETYNQLDARGAQGSRARVAWRMM